jgi:hypothetical protein
MRSQFKFLKVSEIGARDALQRGPDRRASDSMASACFDTQSFRFALLLGTSYAECRLLWTKWVPVTTAWRVLRLRIEERPPIWRVAANILKKQSRTADKGWFSSLGVGLGANNTSP